MTEEEFDEKYLESILERNPHLVTRLKIHPWRWRLLAIWMVGFTLLTFFLIRQNRAAITELNDTKASIHQLEKTNCALRDFLLVARDARAHQAEGDKDAIQRDIDRAAADNYQRLANTFNGGCHK